MTTFYVLTENSSYRTKTEVTEIAQTADEAYAIGVRGGTTIAEDEVTKGKSVSAVIVSVEDGVGAEIKRGMVTIAVAPLVARGTDNAP